MNNATYTSVSRWATPVVALALVLGLYGLARLPALPSAEEDELAGRFRFTRSPLPEAPGDPPRQLVRKVHPSLERISGWISTLGAAVALADLDGDGLPNDLCHVDPRTDRVIVAPVPDAPERYRPFVLDAAPLPFDSNTTAPMGCLVGDFNEDGRADVLVYYWGRTPVLFLRKTAGPDGLCRDAYVARELVPGDASGYPDGKRWFTNAVTQADLDGDGHLDLIVANYFQDGGHILDPNAGGVEVMHKGKAKAFNGGLKHLFRWVSAAHFEEQKEALDEVVNRSWTLAVGAADLDGDLLPEVYFANDFGPDRLLHNRSTPGRFRFAVVEGRRTLTKPTSCVLGHDTFKGMGCDFGDLNGDGVPDIYVSNIATEFGLQESHFLWRSTGDARHAREEMARGIAPYVQASEELGLSRSGWGWDCRLVDFDNDGVHEAVQAVGFLKGKVNRWPELQALGTANSAILDDPRLWPRFKPGDDLSGHDVNPFFVRGKDGRYHNLVEKLRASGLGEPMVSRGIAVADVDGDGQLDFAVANQWEPSYFFRNGSPKAGAFLGLRLLLAPGRPAIGAQATVHLPDGRRMTAQVDGGSGHSGKRSPDLHFGLGSLAEGSKVEVGVRWRGGDGRPQEKTLELASGWHTILLRGEKE
jgi:hypothetical protein